jgi:ABC-type sugar transport system substrate-binding protein
MKQRPFCIAAAVTILLPLGAMSAAGETLAVFTKSAGNPIARATRAGAEQVAKANGSRCSTIFRPR